MRKIMVLAAAAAALFAVPAAAQDVVPGNAFAGVSAGVHDLRVEESFEDTIEGIELDDSSVIYGVFAGYDLPLGPGLFVGAEGNYNFGSDAIDEEYGVAARLGTRLPGGTKLYGKVGYQNISIDPNELVGDDGIDFDGVDTSEGDWLVGLGADVALGGLFVRANVDTISFDTLRATAGVGIKF